MRITNNKTNTFFFQKRKPTCLLAADLTVSQVAGPKSVSLGSSREAAGRGEAFVRSLDERHGEGRKLGVFNGFPRVFNGFPRVFNGFPRVFNGFPRVFNGFPRVFNGFPRVFNGFRRVFNGFPRVFNGFPRVFNGFPSVFLVFS